MQVGADDLVLRRKALRDGRFGKYARLSGLTDADHARGKLEHLWLDCYEQGTDTLPEWLVEERLGPGSADRLVEASLAVFTSTSPAHAGRALVIHGADTTALSRSKIRKQRIRAGKARAATATRIDGAFASGPPAKTGSRPQNEPAEHPATRFADSSSDLPDQGSLSGVPDSQKLSSGSDRRSKGKKAGPMPADWQPDETVRAIADELGLDLNRETASMRDWCAANPAKAKKADWQAFARNWMRNGRRSPQRPQQSLITEQLRRIAEMEREP